MSRKLRELQARKATNITNMRALAEKAESEDRDLTNLEAREFNRAKSEVIELNAAIEHEQAMIERDRTGTDARGGGSPQAIKDTNGRRVGTLLDAETLRDEGAIATALGCPDTIAGDGSAESVFDGHRGGLAEFFRGVGGGATTPAIKASLNEGTDSDGGYAVPNWLLPGILKALVPQSSMLNAGAKMAVLKDFGDSYRLAAVDTVPQPTWRLELAAVTTAGPTFRVVNIVPRDLSMIFLVSRELLADAPNMDDALRLIVSQAFGKEIDRAGLMGTGAAPEITGVRNVPGVQVYSMGANGAALANYAPFIQARTLLANVNAPMPNAVITSPREDETLNLLVDTLGQPLRRPPALEPVKFLTTSQIPINDTQGTASNASSMYLGAWNLATFYLRERVSIMQLRELYAGTGAIGFACHARIDMELSYPQAFAVIEGVIP